MGNQMGSDQADFISVHPYEHAYSGLADATDPQKFSVAEA